MAARIDQGFRNYVFKHIVREKHRAIGESHGVDIPTVVKSCYTAQQQVFTRDVILCVLLAILLLLPIIGIILIFGTFTNGNVNPILPLLSVFAFIGVVMLGSVFVLFVLLAQIKKIPMATLANQQEIHEGCQTNRLLIISSS